MTMLDTTAASLALTRPRYRAPEVQTPAPWRHRSQNLLCHKCDSHNSDYGTITMTYRFAGLEDDRASCDAILPGPRLRGDKIRYGC